MVNKNSIRKCKINSKRTIILLGIIEILLLISIVLKIPDKRLVGLTGAFMILALFLIIVSEMKTYLNLRKLEVFSLNFPDIQHFDFWNHRDCFLTEKYLVVIDDKEILCIKYTDIISISKKTDYTYKSSNNGSSIEKKLYIVVKTRDKKEIEIRNFIIKKPDLVMVNLDEYLIEKMKGI